MMSPYRHRRHDACDTPAATHSRGHQFVPRYAEGFSHFVTSKTAPIAFGWSDCWVGLAVLSQSSI
jgi:hypothetical protein